MTVICGGCGNNACNGGRGMVDGLPCAQCESAHQDDAQQALVNDESLDGDF